MTRSGAYRSSAIAAFGLAVVLMGCGGRESQSPSTAPPTTAMIGPTVPPAGPTTLDPRAGDKARLTASQAFTLSRMLVKNEQAKGAAAEMVVQSGSAEKFTLRGSVDWAGDEGSFVMSIIGSDGVTVPESRVIWDRGSLFTEVAGLEKAMEAKGRPGVTFVQRALDPQTVSLDALVAFVGSLAVDRAENPILLRQGDTAFLGSKTVDGVAVDGYRFGKTRYWIDPSSGLLRQVEARFARYDQSVVITLTDQGPHTIEVPPASAVVDATTIPDILSALTTPKP